MFLAHFHHLCGFSKATYFLPQKEKGKCHLTILPRAEEVTQQLSPHTSPVEDPVMLPNIDVNWLKVTPISRDPTFFLDLCVIATQLHTLSHRHRLVININ